jgi:hypothetical protein
MPAYLYSATSPLRRITFFPNLRETKSGFFYKFYYGLFIMQKTREHLDSRQYSNNNGSIFQTRKIYCYEKRSYRQEPRYIYYVIRREPD